MLHQELSKSILPVGLGPDEIAHIDNSYFKLRKPDQKINLIEGLTVPGRSPLYQGHQGPLSYFIGAKLLSIIHKDEFVGPFFDYQARLKYNGDTKNSPTFSGLEKNVSSEVTRFRRGIFSLRTLSGFYYILLFFITYLIGIKIFKNRHLEVAAFSIFAFSLPSAIWQSFFVNNDILAVFFTSIVFILCAYLINSKSKITLTFTFVLTVLAAAGFLSKYNGIAGLIFIILAILLKKDSSSKIKILNIIFSNFLFLVLIFPELLFNYNSFGEFFPSEYFIKISPHLYKPSSVAEILTNAEFLSKLFRSFFISFQFNFSSWPHQAWFYINSLGFAGLSFLGLSSLRKKVYQKEKLEKSVISKEVILFSSASLLIVFSLLLYFATSFPLSHGRYILAAKLPILFLSFLGISVLVQKVLNNILISNLLILFLSLVFFFFNINFIYKFSKEKYSSSFYLEQNLPESGLSLVAGDIDGDKEDELIFYQRARPRIFIAKYDSANKNYKIIPEWTRVAGYFSDEIFVFDHSGDGKDDLIFFRKAKNSLHILYADFIISHNKDISENSFYANNFEFYPFNSEDAQSVFLLDSFNFALFNPERNQPWRAKNILVGEFFGLAPVSSSSYHAESPFIPFIFSLSKKKFLGSYDKVSGKIRLRARDSAKKPKEILLRPQQNLVSLDLFNDGTSEIISWKKGGACLEIYFFDSLNETRKNTLNSLKTQKQTRVCLKYQEKALKLLENFELVEVKGLKFNKLILFNKLTGVIYELIDSSAGDTSCNLKFKGAEIDCGVRLGFDGKW